MQDDDATWNSASAWDEGWEASALAPAHASVRMHAMKVFNRFGGLSAGIHSPLVPAAGRVPMESAGLCTLAGQ